MIGELIQKLKGVLPDDTWDFIFQQYKPHAMKFSQPEYQGVRVSPDYILVRVPVKKKGKKNDAPSTSH